MQEVPALSCSIHLGWPFPGHAIAEKTQNEPLNIDGWLGSSPACSDPPDGQIQLLTRD
jgi:hypothetical protein